MAQGFHGPDEPLCLTSPEKWCSEALWVHALTRDGAPPYSCRVCTYACLTLHYTRLQVVQRSLTGGYLTEDAALLNANVRSMFDEKLGRSPHENPTAQGGQNEHPSF